MTATCPYTRTSTAPNPLERGTNTRSSSFCEDGEAAGLHETSRDEDGGSYMDMQYRRIRRRWSVTFGLSSISPVFRIQPEHRSKLDSSPISGRMGTSRTFGKCPAITITSIRRESATSQRTRVTGLSTVPIPLIKRITIRTAQKSTSNWPSRPAGRVLSDESSLPKAITWRWMRRHPRTKRSLLSKGCFIKSHGTRLRPASSR